MGMLKIAGSNYALFVFYNVKCGIMIVGLLITALRTQPTAVMRRSLQ